MRFLLSEEILARSNEIESVLEKESGGGRNQATVSEICLQGYLPSIRKLVYWEYYKTIIVLQKFRLNIFMTG